MPQTKLQPKPLEQLKRQTRTEIKPQPKPQIKPQPKPIIRLQQRQEQQRKVKERPPGEPGKEYEPTQEEINNAAALKAGFGWWLKFENGKVKFYKELPPGVKDVKPGEKSGYRSVQTFEGKPEESGFKMGFMNVGLHRPAREPGKTGAVSYTPVLTRKRPGLPMERDGKVIHLKGIGFTRKVPKGRILKEKK